MSVSPGGTAIAISNSSSCFIYIYSSLPKEKERGSKGRAIYRAVGNQVTYTILYSRGRIHFTYNAIYNLYSYRHSRHLQKGKKVRKYKGAYIRNLVARSTGAQGRNRGCLRYCKYYGYCRYRCGYCGYYKHLNITVETGRHV